MAFVRGILIILVLAAAWAAVATPSLALAPPPGEGGEAPRGGGFLGLLFPLLLTFAIFYFLLVRPQQRQTKDRNTMLKALKKGDEVVTTGGLHGKIMGLTDKIATLEVADVAGQKIRLKCDRDHIARQEKSTQG
jgi:preprotein translocase subunit YajC